MIFWTRVKQAINNLWYPRSVTVGKPVETQELANRIARESTVSPADTHAVLRALPNIMAGFMKESRAVHFEGLGWFRNTTVSAGNGVATREEVSSDQITGLRVQFTPDRIRNMSGGYTRALIADEGITFMECEVPLEDNEMEFLKWLIYDVYKLLDSDNHPFDLSNRF